MRQTTTAKVRLDAGKAARFSASAQSTEWLVSRCARGARFTIAHDRRRRKPWRHSHTEIRGMSARRGERTSCVTNPGRGEA